MNPKPEKIQNINPKHLVWNFLTFEHLNLFRISCFEFCDPKVSNLFG